MSDTATATIIHLKPTEILPDPDNPRGTLRDIDKMAASIRQHGILEPITVRFVEADNRRVAMVVRGHRRHAGAIDASLDTMPCITEAGELTELSRATTRIVENLQRDDFTPVEEARAVQQLLDLGLDTTAIATSLAVDIERVTSAVALSGSTVATAVVEKYDLTFDQAMVLVEFDTDKGVIKELTAIAKQRPHDWDHAVARFRQDRTRVQAIEEATTQAKAKGYKILTHRPAWDDKKCRDIDELRADKDAKGHLTTAAHKNCPGRAVLVVYQSWNGKVELREFCVDFPANGHTTTRGASSSSSPPLASLTPAQQEKTKLENRQHRACMNAGRAAKTVRLDFVRSLLKQRVPRPGILKFAITEEMCHGVRREDPKGFCGLVGLEAPKGMYADITKSQRAFTTKLTERQLPLALFARVVTNLEFSWDPNTYKTNPEMNDRRRAYLNLLVASGYTLSTIEKVTMGKASPKEVLAEADALKAATGKATPTPRRAAPAKPKPTKRVAAKRAPARKRASK